MTPLIDIKDLVVTFDELPALRGVDISISRGEAVGVIGESGCGKSVTWLAALGLLPKATVVRGSVRFAGSEILHAPTEALDAIRGRRAAMIFQDAASALNPTHRVGRQVMEVLRLHRGMDASAARAEARRLFEQVGIPDAAQRLEAYPHEFSGGQSQRIAIAMALAGQPEILIADEPTTALDVTIQAQILKLLRDIQRDSGMALALISHDLGVIAEVCRRAYVMYAGSIIEEGPISDLFSSPSHPYTRGLVAALPSLEGPRRRPVSIPGAVPIPDQVQTCCPFAPRCAERTGTCDTRRPELKRLQSVRSGEHRVACLERDSADLLDDAA